MYIQITNDTRNVRIQNFKYLSIKISNLDLNGRT